LKHIPSIYQRKADRASYAAGYRRGFAGLEMRRASAARGEDAQVIYEHGYSDAIDDGLRRAIEKAQAVNSIVNRALNPERDDAHNREVDRETYKQAGNALTS
jgi:hypothetical protein